MKPDTAFPKIQVYAQPAWHDAAAIVGDRAGLAALRDALNDLFEDARFDDEARHVIVRPFAYDGEGYTLVLRLSEAEPADGNHYGGIGDMGGQPPSLPTTVWDAVVADTKSQKVKP